MMKTHILKVVYCVSHYLIVLHKVIKYLLYVCVCLSCVLV